MFKDLVGIAMKRGKGFRIRIAENPRRPFYRRLRRCCDVVDQRYVTTVFLSSGIFFNYLQRVVFYIALVDMTKEAAVPEYAYSTTGEHEERCPYVFWGSFQVEKGPFADWSMITQGYILASFFVGYFLTGIFGGYISDKYGGKQIFGVSVLLTSVCSIMTTLLSWPEVDFILPPEYGPYYLMFVRCIMGLVQGPMFPAASSMLSKWSPPNERTLLNAIANSGVPMGCFLGNLLAGVILDNYNWQWVFYIFGVLGVFWFILWEIFAFSTPANHKYISSAEKAYIHYSTHFYSPPPKGDVPWKDILTSPQFRVVAFANFGFDWGFNLVNIELPFYLRRVIHFPIKQIGIASSIPWICMFFGAIVFAEISQFIIKEGVIRKVSMRKSMAVLSTLLPGVLMIVASSATCSHILVCVVFSISMFYAGASYSGIRLSVVDLAPNFSGILMSLVGTFGSLAGFGVPMMVHYIVQEGTLKDWRLSFCIANLIMLFSSLPYFLYCTPVTQPWNGGTDRVRRQEIHPPSTARPPTAEVEKETEFNWLDEMPFRFMSID